MASPISDPSLPWATVSDLAEYAFCPRAHWYRHHPPDAPIDPRSARSARAGVVYHDRALSRMHRREERGAMLALIAFAVAAGLLVLLVALGAI